MEVNLHKPNCCTVLHEYSMPCEHVLLVLYRQKMLESDNLKSTIERFWEKRFHAVEYYKAYSQAQVFIPHAEKGEYTGPVEDRLKPPTITKTRGRPANKRRRTKVTVQRRRRYLKKKFKKATEPGMERLLRRTPPEMSPELPPPPADPTVITSDDVHVSMWVAKDFGIQLHFGEVEFTDVEEGSDKKIWHVKYQDGDEEDLSGYEIARARKLFLQIFEDDETHACPNVPMCPGELTCDDVRKSMWVAKDFGDQLYFGEVQFTDVEEGTHKKL